MSADTPPAETTAATPVEPPADDTSAKGTETKKPTRKASANGTVLIPIHVAGKRYEVGDAAPDLTKEEAEKLTRLGCIQT